MNLEERNKKIKELRENGLTYKEIGNIIGLSGSRIGQIVVPAIGKVCPEHQGRFYTVCCQYCSIKEKYTKIIEDIKNGDLRDQIRRLSIQDRKKGVVIQRALLIKKLKDEKKLSFVMIGKILNRDHTSIINLYYKKI